MTKTLREKIFIVWTPKYFKSILNLISCQVKLVVDNISFNEFIDCGHENLFFFFLYERNNIVKVIPLFTYHIFLAKNCVIFDYFLISRHPPKLILFDVTFKIDRMVKNYFRVVIKFSFLPVKTHFFLPTLVEQ